MINSKAVLIPMFILLITLIRQVVINWGENTSAFVFYLFGVVFLAIVLIYSLLVSKKKKNFSDGYSKN
ncbi:hypothetical protein ACIQYS_02870 [Psychrobacillus sp. NPDC096426]|uniref:hypothetical protein n=1 Tax=Psychrobacillus sp. NPDC096426 TaxID=3364491 RepID=UPI0037FE28B6